MHADNVVAARGAAFARALVIHDAPSFLALTLAPPRPLLEPNLAAGTLTLLRADAGIGKSWLALTMAHAAASGATVLGWTAPAPARVVYFDTDLAQCVLQGRLAALAGAAPAPALLRLVTADAQPHGLPDLGTEEGRASVERLIADADLLVLDGLERLVHRGRGAGARWAALADWLASLRRRGVAVLAALGPRAGAGLDTLADTVLRLHRPYDHLPDEGARFSVHTIIARRFAGSAVRRFEARLEVADGVARWTRIEAVDEEAILAWRLHDQGHSTRAIARIFKVSDATGWRLVQRGAKLPPELRLSCIVPDRTKAEHAAAAKARNPGEAGEAREAAEAGEAVKQAKARNPGEAPEAAEAAEAVKRDPDDLPLETLLQILIVRQARQVAGVPPAPDALPQLGEADLLKVIERRCVAAAASGPVAAPG